MKRQLANAILYPYYYGSLPLRWWQNARFRARGSAPVIVLFYHRVADETPNAWSLSTRRFRRQIEWLKERYRFVSLEEAQQRIAAGSNREPVVSVTFDDGYADNSAFALPYLIRRRIPFTYFVSLDHVQHGQPFSHDLARGEPLLTNTPEDLRALAAAGVEIGLHTRTHADLNAVTDLGQLRDEVVTAGSELAAMARSPVRYFAFPFGLHANLNPAAFELAREAGYLGVCSAYGGYNFPGDDAFHIQRCHADPEWMRWKNYLTVDPRKVRGTRRFVYGDDRANVLDEARAKEMTRAGSMPEMGEELR